MLAALNLFCAWQIRRLASPKPTHKVEVSPDLSAAPAQSGLRVLAQAPYLQNLAAVVLLGTTGAALADYMFKTQAFATFGRGDSLLRFFAVYYAAVSLITFVVADQLQSPVARKARARRDDEHASMALMAGSNRRVAAPGLESMMVARGGESSFADRCSVPATSCSTRDPESEKRAAKSLIDVGSTGWATRAGGGLLRLALLWRPGQQSPRNPLARLPARPAGCSRPAPQSGNTSSRSERSLPPSAPSSLELSSIPRNMTRGRSAAR